MNGKSEAFFQSVYDKMKEAEVAIKNNISVIAENSGVRSEDDADAKVGGSQNTAKSPGSRRGTYGTGMYAESDDDDDDDDDDDNDSDDDDDDDDNNDFYYFYYY